MAIALAKSPMLQELHLSGNALGNIGVAALVRGAVAGKCLRGTTADRRSAGWTRISCGGEGGRGVGGKFLILSFDASEKSVTILHREGQTG